MGRRTSATPMRDLVTALAKRLGMRPVSVLKYLTPAEAEAFEREVTWFRFLRVQAEVAACKREPLDAIIDRALEETDRVRAHAQLAADYAELTATPLTADEVGAVLASVPSDTSVLVSWAAGAA